MLKIGLTGGIGSGKTTVAKIFAVLGIPVYDADAAAKRLMQDDTAVKKEIIKEFGNSAYDSDGSINRKYLSTIVFNNYDNL